MMNAKEQAIGIAAALIRAGQYAGPRGPDAPAPVAFSIALSREAGTGGALVGRELGRRLNWPVYDHEILNHLASELHVEMDRLESIDERPGNWLVECLNAFTAHSTITEVTYFRRLLKLILALGAKGHCVIVGRGAMVALPVDCTLRVRLVASLEDRIAFIVKARRAQTHRGRQLRRCDRPRPASVHQGPLQERRHGSLDLRRGTQHLAPVG